MSHRGLAIYIKKYLKAKEEELCKTQIFHHTKIIIFKKILEKKPRYNFKCF